MLKLFLLLASVLSTSAFSMECQQREIQLQAYVQVLPPELGDVHETICRFEIDFSKPIQFSVSGACPLDLDSLQKVQFIDASCQLKQGGLVSGIVVEKNGRFYFE